MPVRSPTSILALLTVTVWVLCASPAVAHQVNTSYTTCVLDSTSAALAVSIDEADLRLAFPDLDANEDGVLWAEEALTGTKRIQSWVAQRLEVRVDGVAASLEPRPPRVQLDRYGTLFVHVPFRVQTVGARRVDIDLSRFLQPPLLAEHRNLLTVTRPGAREVLALLSRDEPVYTVQLQSATPPVSLGTQVARFIWMGMEHIWIGYDHIMFLLALIVVGTRLGPLVKIVSAFTVAHSITLALAALELVSLPPRLVESGIALSIAYVAAENFWLRDSRHRWILTFCFGFVHGFGFASVLRDLGLPTEGLVASLLAFNVGVEIGQVAIVAVLFPAILWLARQPYHERAVRVISGVILLFGLGWLVERVFALSFMPF